jgi:hypothetical protein
LAMRLRIMEKSTTIATIFLTFGPIGNVMNQFSTLQQLQSNTCQWVWQGMMPNIPSVDRN